MTDKLPVWEAWLFSTPWWVPALLATAMTGWMMWVTWPRSGQQEINSNNNGASAEDIQDAVRNALSSISGDGKPNREEPNHGTRAEFNITHNNGVFVILHAGKTYKLSFSQCSLERVYAYPSTGTTFLTVRYDLKRNDHVSFIDISTKSHSHDLVIGHHVMFYTNCPEVIQVYLHEIVSSNENSPGDLITFWYEVHEDYERPGLAL